jgi:hypothetical protein
MARSGTRTSLIKKVRKVLEFKMDNKKLGHPKSIPVNMTCRILHI